MGFELWGFVPVTGSWWDFEDGWQNWWTATGLAYPNGWGVVDAAAPPSAPSNYTAPLNSGDSCFVANSDAFGAVGLIDTAFSPHFTRAADWLYFSGSYQNYAGADTFYVIVRERLGGGVWGSWARLAEYSSDMGSWDDSIDVSSLGDTLQVAFVYDAVGIWGWYAAFDNVGPWLDTMTLAVAEAPVVTPEVFNYRMLSTNPISNNAVIQFALPVNGNVNFKVYDITGREVLSQSHGMMNAGVHTLTWNRNDNRGNQVSAGSYFFRLEAAGNVATGKFIVTE
jgi:hypothetical protein